MSKRVRKSLSAGELEMLQLLWNHPAGLTLAAAHEAIQAGGRDIGYTTVQTRLERLVEKGVVAKSRQRPAIYVAALARDDVGSSLLDSLLDRLSGAVPLFAHLVQNPAVSQDDLQEMRRLIDEAERRLDSQREPRS